MKVLHIVNSLGTGGAELMLVRLLQGMDRNRFENTVVSLLRIDTFAPDLHKLGIRTETLDIRGAASALAGVSNMMAIIKEVRPDLVQTWMYHSNLMGLFATRLAIDAPLVWSVHSSELDFSTYSIGLKLLFKLSARMASMPDAIVCTSQVAQQWHERLGFKSRRWQYVPAGIDTSIFRPDPDARLSLRRGLGLPPDALVIGTAGRFHPQKDYPTFLRAFARLSREIPEAHAVMAGVNVASDNRELMGLVRLLGIQDRVQMLGLRADIRLVLAGLDLFVLASAFGESCPTVLIEAMACGVPCVATNIGDSGRIVGDTGRIVPPRDPAALAGACVEMLRDRRANSSEAARHRIRENYSLHIMTNGFADLFADLVGRNPRKAKPRYDRRSGAHERGSLNRVSTTVMATAMRIRHSLKQVLYGSAAELPRIVGITAMRGLPSRANSLRILAYHKVSDARPNIIAVGTELFSCQQEYLAARYQVISPDAFADHVRLGTPLPERAVLLTFDDGYTSVYKNAYPILKALGHRAIMFVPTDYLGGGILPHDRDLSGEDRVLSYQDLGAMRDVFEIGSHGCSHRILTRLPPHEIETEITESKRKLEQGLGIAVRAFAYPNGGYGDFDDATEEVVRRAGYQLCFTGIAGTNLSPLHPMRLHRYTVEDFGMRYFTALLDGSADLLRFKDSPLGISVKAVVNRTLGLQ